MENHIELDSAFGPEMAEKLRKCIASRTALD